MSKNKETMVPDGGHKHELTDRVHCMNTMFEELIATHPAAVLVTEEVEAVRLAINELYQKIGMIHCDHVDPAEGGTAIGCLKDIIKDNLAERVAAKDKGVVQDQNPVLEGNILDDRIFGYVIGKTYHDGEVAAVVEWDHGGKKVYANTRLVVRFDAEGPFRVRASGGMKAAGFSWPNPPGSKTDSTYTPHDGTVYEYVDTKK